MKKAMMFAGAAALGAAAMGRRAKRDPRQDMISGPWCMDDAKDRKALAKQLQALQASMSLWPNLEPHNVGHWVDPPKNIWLDPPRARPVAPGLEALCMDNEEDRAALLASLDARNAQAGKWARQLRSSPASNPYHQMDHPFDMLPRRKKGNSARGRRAGWEKKFQRRPLGDLPSRAEEFAAAWRHSRQEMMQGRIGSLEAAKERRLILREAEAEGVLDEVVALTTGSAARGRRVGPPGYEVDDWGEQYVSSGLVGPLPRGDRRWKSSWDDDFRAGFAAGTKAKKIIPASTAYNRGKISQRHGSEWMVGYSAAIGVKRGLYATTPVRRAEALGLINQGRRAEKKPAIWGYINWTEGRQHPTRYSMPVYSAKQAYRTEDAFADRHPSKKRVSISRKKPRNARPVPQHDDAWE